MKNCSLMSGDYICKHYVRTKYSHVKHVQLMMLDSVVNIRYVDRKVVRNELSFTTTRVK